MKNYFVGLCISLNKAFNRQECDLQYVNSFIDMGLKPLLLPYKIEKENINSYLDLISGLVLTGGNDVDPSYYNETRHEKIGNLVEERDTLEFAIFNEAMKRNMPILGICRGFQLINVALGGSLIQDIESEYDTNVIHSIQGPETESYKKRHDVIVIDNTPATAWFYGQSANVNTFHHQAVKTLGSTLEPSVKAKDGIIEAFFSQKYKNIIAVQWHPEREHNTISKRLFDDFKKLCDDYEKNKQ